MNKLHKQALMVATLAASISGMALAASDSVGVNYEDSTPLAMTTGGDEQQSANERATIALASDVLDERRSSESGKVYPAFEAGVRHAADLGPDALRHYIERTRMIYGFYYWDFAK